MSRVSVHSSTKGKGKGTWCSTPYPDHNQPSWTDGSSSSVTWKLVPDNKVRRQKKSTKHAGQIHSSTPRSISNHLGGQWPLEHSSSRLCCKGLSIPEQASLSKIIGESPKIKTCHGPSLKFNLPRSLAMHLSRADYFLGSRDTDWHLPLLIILREEGTKNQRQRNNISTSPSASMEKESLEKRI